MKTKDKSSEQRFGHVNATIAIHIWIFFIKLVTQQIRTFEGFFKVFKNLKNLGF